MACQRNTRPRVRDVWRMTRRNDHGKERWRARMRRGQTLVIFALSFTVLLGLAGLAIDVARMYDLYARMQRAAESGALAGVMYLPDNYSTGSTYGSAVSSATAEVAKNGFGTTLVPPATDCPSPVSSVEVAVCQVAGKPSDLQVTITEHLSLVLLAGLGMTPVTLQATAQAEYLPPVQAGARGIFFGDQVECSNGSSTNLVLSSCAYNDSTQVHVQDYMATIDGPAELKEAGDPYVYCQEGNSQIGGTDPTINNTITYNGISTNHTQYIPGPGWTPITQYCGAPVAGTSPSGNPDQQPAGYSGPMTTGTSHPGGYSYYIGITPQVAAGSLWIFNPYYAPVDSANSLDHFLDKGSTYYYQGPNEEGLTATMPFDGTYHDAPLFFFRTTFSLYQINSVYNPGDANSLIAEESFKPFDATSADLSTHGCASGQLYDPNWSNGTGNGNTDNTYYHPNGMVGGVGCVSQPLDATTAPNSYNCTWVMQWCQLYNFSTAAASNTDGTPVGTAAVLHPADGNTYTGQYRLVVEVTGLNAKNNVYNSTSTDGWGQHGYSLKLCNGSPVTPVNCDDGTGSNGASNYNNPAMYIYGLNNMDVTFQTALTNTPANPNYPQTSCVTSNTYDYACMDLGCIPTLYAGRTVTLSLFDPGDGAGNLFLGVSPPQGAGTGTSVAYSYSGGGAIPTMNYDGRNVFQVHYANASPPYNGLWVDVTLTLSSSYIGDCATTSGKSGYSGWWQLAYLTTDTSSASQPLDQIGVKFTLVGSPVHLTTVG